MMRFIDYSQPRDTSLPSWVGPACFVVYTLCVIGLAEIAGKNEGPQVSPVALYKGR